MKLMHNGQVTSVHPHVPSPRLAIIDGIFSVKFDIGGQYYKSSDKFDFGLIGHIYIPP
jgi:hypothetical protein